MQLDIVDTATRTKSWPLGAFLVKWVPNDMAVCIDHAESFELDHFDQNFHLFFWLKVNNDTVFKASILEYDRYEPRLGARSCHRYLEFWQDLKISIYYIKPRAVSNFEAYGNLQKCF